MLVPLSFLVGAEALVALLLISKVPPFYKLGKALVDLLSTSKGTAVSRTLFATVVVLFAASINSVQRTKGRLRKAGGSGNPGHEQFLLRAQIMEAAMLGYSLLLAVAVNRFYAFLSENANLKLQLEGLKKKSEGIEAECKRIQHEQKSQDQKLRDRLAEEMQSSKDVIADLRRNLENVQIDANAKEQELRAAQASLKALQKQAHGSQLEYMRILAENEGLRSQLASHDASYYSTEAKKDA